MKADLMLLGCVWHSVANGRQTCMLQVLQMRNLVLNDFMLEPRAPDSMHALYYYIPYHLRMLIAYLHTYVHL